MLKLKVACVLAICVGLLVAAQAQSPPFPGTFPQGIFTNRAALDAPSGFSPSCSQSSTFLAAATGITLTADKTNYDTMICGLVSDGEWNFDVFYIWAAPSATNAALINLANPGTFNGTVNGTCTFTAYQGYTGDGTSCYIDSGFVASTAPSPKYTQNSATLGVYNRTSRSSGGNLYEAGAQGPSSTALLNLYQFGAFNSTINSTTTITNSSSGTQGAWNITRKISSLESLFQNSNETAVGSASDTSGTPFNIDMVFFAQNPNGSPANFISEQMSAGWIGAGLAGADSCKINNRINTYMAAYSNNIYTNSAC